MITDPDQLTPEQMADLQRQMNDVMPALLETLMLSGHSVTACVSAIAEMNAHLLGLVGGDPVERLGKILPPFLSTAKSAAVVRQMIDAVGTVRARDALTRQMPKEPEKQFRARLALWVIEHLEKGRIV